MPRLSSILRVSIMSLGLSLGGLALADVAPPPDGGSTPDMASTMAKPDMATPVTPKDDGGCSMSHTPSTNAALLLFGASAVGLTLASRRRRAA